MAKTNQFSMKGWDIGEFIKGRKELLITGIGYVGSYIVTQDPMLSGMVAAGTELVASIINYYCKK